MLAPNESDAPDVSDAMLRQYVERVERLEEEIKELNADKSDVFQEAKGNGFDVKALKTIIKIRRQDDGERREHDAVVETYAKALGIIL